MSARNVVYGQKWRNIKRNGGSGASSTSQRAAVSRTKWVRSVSDTSKATSIELNRVVKPPSLPPGFRAG